MPATRLAALAVAVALVAPAGRAQDHPLSLQGLTPVGGRARLTDTGGTVGFTVANGGDAPRDARVVVEYDARPGARFARDVWVPPRAALSAWLPLGAAPPAGDAVEIRSLLYDRTGGTETLVLRPGEGEKIRARPVPFRARTPTTALIADEPHHSAAAAFVKLVRKAATLPDEVTVPPDGPLPPTPEAFDGVDHVVVAGNRLAGDPAGRWALRQWVARGGRLWVLLDLVDADSVAPLLGDDRPVEVVDRVGLTRVHLAPPRQAAQHRDFDQPVEHVRVLPADRDRVFAVANDWPAGFARDVGRGRVVVTTLGAAGWLPPPPPPPGAKGAVRGGPAPGSEAVQELAAELHPPSRPAPLPADALRPLLDDEVGYAVMGRGTAAVVLGGFLAAVAGIGVGLRRSRRPELVGWLAPVAAAGAAGVFVGHAELTRGGVPPTVAVVAVAEPVSGTDEVTLSGVLAVFQPDPGPVPLAAPRGGSLDLDAAGLEGQTRTRVVTDTDAWHVEGLDLPAGVRTGVFRATTRPGAVTAAVRFGPAGVEGRLTAPGLSAPADALVVSAQRQPLAARFGAEGVFATGDDLPPGQLLPGAVLSDRQQRRQAVYRQVLAGPLPPHLDGRDLLLAWADAAAVPFAGRDGGRAVGTILLVTPLTFERTPPGTRVAVPAAFVPVRRPDLGRPTLDSSAPTEQLLRFQLPPSVLPLEVERAVLRLRVRAPGRRVAVRAGAETLFVADGPAEPVRVEITDARHLRPDADGGLLLTVSITDPAPAPVPWKIEELGLDVVGRTAGGP
ncbi:MAG: hypothetical protein U0804_09945 [Gemmataceae bacterium]